MARKTYSTPGKVFYNETYLQTMVNYLAMNDTDVTQKSAQLDNPNAGPEIYCLGDWTIRGIRALQYDIAKFSFPENQEIKIDGYNVTSMDSAGGWLLLRLINSLKNEGKTVSYSGFRQDHQELLQLLASREDEVNAPAPPVEAKGTLYIIGEETYKKYTNATSFLGFVGELASTFANTLLNPKRIQWRSILNAVDQVGYRSLPIIALLMFLIGIVLAYQIGIQLKTYGANIFIVGLTGIAILREFSPLIVAIIIAGRSGSAFTAQIGTMIVNSEVDALRAMGLSPINRLVIPKFIGAIIAIPLLIVWGDIFGVLGSMVMAKTSLGINYYDYYLRFQQDVELRHFFVGLSKAPFFAMIIATVGCFQGFQVSFSAASVGQRTTQSVVQSIFLIIITDALFSVMFSWVGV